jgi:hypothetical protein
MKTSKAIRVAPALLGLVLFSATAANAHTVRSRPACGVVERLDMATRTSATLVVIANALRLLKSR